MFARRAIATALLLGLVGTIGGPGARPVLAGVDVCPEPNSELVSACFLGSGTAAPGYLDTADDVDTYRIELAPETMVIATLASRAADLGLRLRLPDGSVHSQAVEPGRSDKVVQADGLAPGTYFLSVVSLRGESNPDQPYMLGVSYPPSILLTTPNAPTAPPGVPQGAYGYVPAPARNYGLQATDLGSGLQEVERGESEDGREFFNRFVAQDVFLSQQVPASRTTIGLIDTTIILTPYGSNDDVGTELEQILAGLRSQGLNVQPTVGWGSEQVYSFADVKDDLMYRGIALRHRNAVVFMEMTGFQQHVTWDAISRLMSTVEKRIHAAVQ